MSELEFIVRKSMINSPRIQVPPSKSYTHRALIAASLSQGKTIIRNPLLSDDTLATIGALRELGALITIHEDSVEVNSAELQSNQRKATIDCRESGTTMRLLIGVYSVLGANVTLTGKEGLLKRPTKDGVSALKNAGVMISDSQGFGPVIIEGLNGNFRGGTIKVRGDTSSQFISGLLLGLPLAKKDSTLIVTTPIESQPYIEMTLEVLRKFGIKVTVSKDYRKYEIPGGQAYHSPQIYDVEGDYSSAAFLVALGAIEGPHVKLAGLVKNSTQADSEILNILSKMGGTYTWEDNILVVKKAALKGVTVDVESCPDLVPILALLATQANGKTMIINAGRLRIKESDRLSAITTELKGMGAAIKEGKDSLEIKGPTRLKSARIDPHNDHRIAMACTIGGLIAKGETILSNPEVVKKSYPDFFHHLRKMNATILSQTKGIGERFTIQLYGGSHEKAIGVRIKGIPKGTIVNMDHIRHELEKRRPFGTLTTPRREQDEFEIISGLANGETTGEALVVEVPNKDVNSQPYEISRCTPRPNHGDYTTYLKYGGVFDFRGGGFLSARMTVGTVIAGAIAKQVLSQTGIEIAAFVAQVGQIKIEKQVSFEEIKKETYKSEVRCPDPDASQKIREMIEAVKKEGDSLGGVIECRVVGLPPGIGEPVFHSLDSVISTYLFGIPAVKGVEFGSGFEGAGTTGSENNDVFEPANGVIVTRTNNSGGIQGGISNGMPLVVRVAIKPTSSILKEQQTINMKTGSTETIRVLGRHDPCVAIRAPVIVEAHVACALLDLIMRR